MENPTQIFIILVLAGLLLILFEVIVPGGIIGVFGGLALLAASIVSFSAFGPSGGMIATVGILVLVGAVLAIWIAIFPRTRVGRVLTLSKSTKEYKSTPDEHTELIDKEGIALSTLRPAGLAKIDGHRVDVIADGEYIDEGATVRVIQVEGARIVVREIQSS